VGNKKMNINDVLNDSSEDVQSFEKVEKKATKLKKLEEEKNKRDAGRPTKTEEEKAKKRTLYYTDEEYAVIEKIAGLYGISANKWIKMVISKELRREGAL
jgi:predicted HicB family RNase H-like nuclease